MTTGKPPKVGIAEKAQHEFRELIILTAYLYATFSAVLFYKHAVLGAAGISWMPWGLAFIKAVLVAKFVLLGRALRIDQRYQTKPLIWPTLHESVLFLVIVMILTGIEEAVVGLFHGRTIRQSMAGIGGGNPEQFVASLLLPYFAIRSLDDAMGEKSLIRLFFVERQEFRAVKRSVQEN
jgi:hypothetical protein